MAEPGLQGNWQGEVEQLASGWQRHEVRLKVGSEEVTFPEWNFPRRKETGPRDLRVDPPRN